MTRARSLMPYLRATAFLGVAALLFHLLTLVCISVNWHAGHANTGLIAYHNVRDMKDISKDHVDVAVFGASVAMQGISPMPVFEECGIRVQNYGVPNQNMLTTYLQIEEFLRTQSVKVLLLETYSLHGGRYVFNPMGFRLLMDGFPFSMNKIRTIRFYYDTYAERIEDSALSCILPIAKYHTLWKNLSEFGLQPFDQRTPFYYFGGEIVVGFVSPTLPGLSFKGWQDTGTELYTTQPGFPYLIKILQLCREKNIQPVLFRTPSLKINDIWAKVSHNSVQKVADEMNVPFIDFHMQDVFSNSGYDLAMDQNAGYAHANRSGARKISLYLGRYLRDNFDLPDRRNDPEYAYMHAELARYTQEMFNQDVVDEKKMAAYLGLLSSPGASSYTVIFSVKGDCQAKMSGEVREKLRELGFVSDSVFKSPGHSFIGVWRNGKVLHEAESPANALEYRAVLPDGLKYYVKSAGLKSGNASSIVINGAQYSGNLPGFNVAVYDHASGRVIDRKAWEAAL